MSSLSLLERLSDTKDDLKAGGVGAPNLLSNDFICFTEEFTALRMTDEGPLKAKVDDLLRADFTSESTVSFGADVLGGDEDILVEHRLCSGDVKGNRSDKDFNATLIELHHVHCRCAEGTNRFD